MIRMAALAAALLLPAGALASQATADACAKSLSKDARTIYDKVAADPAPNSSLFAEVKAQTRALAMAGSIALPTAKSNAQSAGKCLAKR